MVSIPELGVGPSAMRIPDMRSVSLTRRVMELIDHPAFQRLRTVRQTAAIHLVYPGAVHTRFEHSIGVFDMARQYLNALLRHDDTRAALTESDILVCLLGALLHDIGHYPFAHSLEALHHKGMDTPRHEDLAGRIIRGEQAELRGEASLADLIAANFNVDPQDVIDLITRKPTWHARPERRLVATVISSGVDADKADYLERDSLHMGVAYGRHVDRARFLDSLCPNVEGDALAITNKGKVAAEMFIFSRYLMFSEAYWHHTVRAVSAMVERALSDFQQRTPLDHETLTRELLSRSDDALLEWLVSLSPEGTMTRRLLGPISTRQRRFYKRVLALSRVFDDLRRHHAYDRIYHLDRVGLANLRAALADTLARVLRTPVTVDDVIIDTPPRDKDMIETVDVVWEQGGQRTSRRLEEISKVVQGIATDFVKVVKKIRVFVAPEIRDTIDAHEKHDAVSTALLQTILDFRPEADSQQVLL